MRSATLLALLAACQAYEARPLDVAAHREAWHARTLDDPALTEFLDAWPEATEPDGQPTPFDPTDGLTLAEARLVALIYNPDLRLARLRVGRAAVDAELAGIWGDPQLSFDLLRVRQDVPDRWVATPSLAVPLPLSGRLDAERDLADAELRTAELAAREAEWQLAWDLESAWVAWAALRLRATETERWLEALDGFVDVSARLAEAGEIPRTEATLFRVEQLASRNRLRRLHGDAAAAEQVVRALVGLAPEAPVTFLPGLPSDDESTTDAGAAARRPGDHPSLARLAAAHDAAEQTLRREIAEQFPDLWLGPRYESDAGQNRFGLTGWMNLPLWNANQGPIARAEVDRELARAAFEVAYERLVGRWAVALASAQGLADQRAELEATLLPLVERQLEDAFELLRLGEGSSLLLLESLNRAFQARLDQIDLRVAESLARSEVRFLLGPDTHPGSTEPADTEDRVP
jgi:cobalt-zinc-cadmium efflux system outer membrane protein